jgi:biopolymer transport protein ExbD
VLKRPSARNKAHKQGVELNLVPILDTMVTLIGFLLFTTSFLAMVSIESPLPQAGPEEVKEKILEKPLQLTLTLREKSVEIWSPFQKTNSKSIPNTPDGEINLKAIHEALIEVKKAFPNETQIVLAPHARTSYDVLISLMDTIRTLDSTDPSIFVRNEKTGVDETSQDLFPKVVFGNLLGDP